MLVVLDFRFFLCSEKVITNQKRIKLSSQTSIFWKIKKYLSSVQDLTKKKLVRGLMILSDILTIRVI